MAVIIVAKGDKRLQIEEDDLSSFEADGWKRAAATPPPPAAVKPAETAEPVTEAKLSLAEQSALARARKKLADGKQLTSAEAAVVEKAGGV